MMSSRRISVESGYRW